jgi:hypothetical protein
LKLASVTENEWAAIPNVGDYSLPRKKQKRREDVFTPLTDLLIESMNELHSNAMASGGKYAMSGTMQVIDGTMTSSSSLTAGYGTNPMNMLLPMDTTYKGTVLWYHILHLYAAQVHAHLTIASTFLNQEYLSSVLEAD